MSHQTLHGALGLARRSGQLAWGMRAVRQEILRAGAHLVVLATDASPRAQRRIRDLCQERGVAVIEGPPAARLGVWCGLSSLAAVAVLDQGLAESLVRRSDDC